MKRLLLALLMATSSYCGLYIRTPILAKIPQGGDYYRWGHKELFEWGKRADDKLQVITLCDTATWWDSLSCVNFEWCRRPIRHEGYHVYKDYYIYIVSGADGNSETIIATADQRFARMYVGDDWEQRHANDRRCPLWERTDSIYREFTNKPDGLKLLKLPKLIDRSLTSEDSRYIDVIYMHHVVESDNVPLEFFDVSIDESHTFFVGNNNVWVHNMAWGMQAAWGFGGGAAASCSYSGLCTAMQGAVPGSLMAQVNDLEIELMRQKFEEYRGRKTIENGYIVYVNDNQQNPAAPQYNPPSNSGGGGNKNGTDPDNTPKKDGGEHWRKYIKGHEKQIEEHLRKIQEDLAGKNVPKGTPDHLIEIVKEGIMKHHLKEVDTLRNNVAKGIEELAKLGLKR